MGLALPLGLSPLFYREYKRRVKLEKLLVGQLLYQDVRTLPATTTSYEPRELASSNGHELSSNPLHEAGNYR